MSLAIIGLDEIRAAATPALVFAAVRESLIAHAEARTLVPPATHLKFEAVGGDCHVKAGHVHGSRYATVKIASGFPANEKLGLPSNNGVILTFSAETGEPHSVLADEGWITAWRTAAVGALATHTLAPPEITEVGILGTGLQARLQIEWLDKLRPLGSVKVWGRRANAAQKLSADLCAAGIDARASDLEDVMQQDCIITATASTAPLAPSAAFQQVRHVTALGADMPGKMELPSELFARATEVVTDDHEQCLEYSDFGIAVREGFIPGTADVPLGFVLRDGLGPSGRDPNALTIADLTGVGATDAAVANAVIDALDHVKVGGHGGARPL
ncbi:ornithine cyclodeaminase family protein [Sinomonas sp. G460-2]|uniref:ornithine cyclodeaminase family protein n=1 Tax=Sinomonas sp. G460-2 TaxID=3393464 RepID=UPI0039EF1F14